MDPIYELLFYQVPDFLNAKINGMPVTEVITDIKWLKKEFTERVQKVHTDHIIWRYLWTRQFWLI